MFGKRARVLGRCLVVVVHGQRLRSAEARATLLAAAVPRRGRRLSAARVGHLGRVLLPLEDLLERVAVVGVRPVACARREAGKARLGVRTAKRVQFIVLNLKKILADCDVRHQNKINLTAS